MEKYQEPLLARLSGGALQPLSGVSVNVTSVATGLPAALYQDDELTAIPQPLTTDNDGNFPFKAANGKYTLSFSGARIASFTQQIILNDPSDNPALTQAQAASPTGARGIGYGTDTVAGALDALHLADYAALDAYNGPQTSVYVVAAGIAGHWWRDDADSTTPANIGTVRVAANGKRWKRSNVTALDPRWFGAKFDGATNDTAALQAVASVINAQGGGTIALPPQGTAIVGQQTFAGATGNGYAYKAADLLKLSGCANPVVIIGNGAILRLATGLKYGSFDPVTGAAYTPGALPFTSADYVADVGAMISALGCKSVTVSDLELDGNSGALTLGGQWGDSGRQISGYGVYSKDTALQLTNVHTHHHALDGLATDSAGTSPGAPVNPVMLINVRSEYNARQGYSWTGGVGVTAINSKFNLSGRGAFTTAPASGLDVETNAGGFARNGQFIECEFADNAGLGVSANSGNSADVTFTRCRMFGTTTYAINIGMPRFRFTDCLISGYAIVSYAAATRSDAVVFTNTRFSADEAWNGRPVYGSQLYDAQASNHVFDSCSFVSNNAAVKLGSSTAGIYYHNCTFVQNGSTATSTVKGTFYGESRLTISTGSNDFGNSYTVYGRVIATGTVAGCARDTTNNELNALTPVVGAIYAMGSNGAGSYLRNQTTWNYAMPNSGTAAQGDRCINNKPVVGGAEYWKCVAGGSPGTWVANKKRGTFTCSAATSTTVNDTDVQANSVILLMPKNAAAATLMGGATALYVSARTASTSFAVTTANGAAAAGTEQFEYELLN